MRKKEPRNGPFFFCFLVVGGGDFGISQHFQSQESRTGARCIALLNGR